MKKCGKCIHVDGNICALSGKSLRAERMLTGACTPSAKLWASEKENEVDKLPTVEVSEMVAGDGESPLVDIDGESLLTDGESLPRDGESPLGKEVEKVYFEGEFKDRSKEEKTAIIGAMTDDGMTDEEIESATGFSASTVDKYQRAARTEAGEPKKLGRKRK